jgi:hypothetical protein
MGDISRHRNIFYNTQDAIPPNLLQQCKLSAADLTYLELGNYLTDVSQFRDPVMFIFSKQRIWREFIIPKVGDKVGTYRKLAALAGGAALAAGEVIKRMTSGVVSDIAKYTGPVLAGVGGLLAVLPTDTYAGIGGADDWIDKMFGTPIERTTGDLKKRDEKHYGYVGEFFHYFIEGITHLLFAAEISNKVKGEWGKILRMPEAEVTAIFTEFFSQYYPHEHTDQPPYVWDASDRPKNKDWYGASKRQQTLVDKEIGVMNAVDKHYVQYLAEGLGDVELEWRKLKPDDASGRHKMLVRMGKLLHGIEDWYFHSNVVEIMRVRGHQPGKGAAETEEDFLKRFVKEIAAKDPEFVAADQTEQLRLQRRLFRRLRFPAYEKGNRIQSGGIISKNKPSTISIQHAYPAFPSQQDTTHTLLHALENLERKITPDGKGTPPSSLPPWVPCVFGKLTQAKDGEGRKLFEEKARARGVDTTNFQTSLLTAAVSGRNNMEAVVVDVLREWIPLVVTLLVETERQRLVANVAPLLWPVDGTGGVLPPKGKAADAEINQQLERHKKALDPKKNLDGIAESNYDTAVHYLLDCGFINPAGKKALNEAFAIDHKSQQLLKDAPGCGGFLMQFALDLQKVLDAGDAATAELNKQKSAVFDEATDNKAFNEIIGSHSLMSKDTLESPPFFDDARVLASVASSAVFHIMLLQVSLPAGSPRLLWKEVLHYFIRYPTAIGGWERHAMAFFKANNGKIPHYEDLPELANLVAVLLRSPEALKPPPKSTKDNTLKEMYIKLETELSQYRYP